MSVNHVISVENLPCKPITPWRCQAWEAVCQQGADMARALQMEPWTWCSTGVCQGYELLINALYGLIPTQVGNGGRPRSEGGGCWAFFGSKML